MPSLEEITGAEIIVESLKRHGVKTVFFYTGGAILPVGHALGKSGINLVSSSHEGIGTLAAGGYARATGKVGVVVATSGPGGTNCVTGVADAKLDSVPLILITGQVATPYIGKDAFQEVDMRGIMMPITKHNHLVRDVGDLAGVMNESFYIAGTGKKGPVHIDLPKDVQIKKVVPDFEKKISIRGYAPEEDARPDPEQVQKAAKLIDQSRRPVFYVGGGVVASDAAGILYEIATKRNIPVATTLMARQVFSDEHPLGLGMLGMHGTAYANHAVDECDLLIAVAARFDDRVTGNPTKFAPNAKKIHIDIAGAEINKNVSVDVGIVGDARQSLEELCKHLNGIDRSDWVAHIGELKRREAYALTYEPGENIKPQDAITGIYGAMPKQFLATVGVGKHQMWAAQYFRGTNPRSFLSSSGLGTMGFCVPAAVGAQFGLWDIKDYSTQVVAIDGDGSFQQYPQVLATMSKYGLPIKIFIINDGHHGMVRQWQELLHDSSFVGSINPDVDYLSLGKAYGIESGSVPMNEKSSLNDRIRYAFSCRGPYLLDIRVDPNEMVLPMIPAGGKFNDIILAKRKGVGYKPNSAI